MAYLVKGDEEGGSDGDGTGEQDPLPPLPPQVQEALKTRHN